MKDLVGLLNHGIQSLSSAYVDDSIHYIEQLILDLYRPLSDDELQRKILNVREGNTEELINHLPVHKRLLRFLRKIVGLSNIDEETIGLLALGVEAFRRAPADLPEQSFLYRTQIKAAAALNERCVIQMETGEGKTYAILAGTFSLFHRFGRVYIICANDYLAQRDAKRTKSYWDFVGLKVGLALSRHPNSPAGPVNLEADVVYTTLDNLMFTYLNAQSGSEKLKHQLAFNAVVIDEVDSVLLDQVGSPYSLSKGIKSNLFDWSTVFSVCKQLEQNTEILVDVGMLRSQLTTPGIEKLKQLLKGLAGQPPTAIVGFLRPIEMAYTAMYCVKEGEHFKRIGNRFYALDQQSGLVKKNRVPEWLIPLEALHGLAPRPEEIIRTRVNPEYVLRKFHHLAGLSGSIINDSAEYLFSYWLPTVVIDRRTPRHYSPHKDIIYFNEKIKIQEACREITRILSQENRPVLVCCLKETDVGLIIRILKANLPATNQVLHVNGERHIQDALTYAKSGQVGAVTVATRTGARGVDIRLSPEAKANGGLALIGIGHADELRHDHQFLGRAGRQDDPFTAKFYLSTEDGLFARYNNDIQTFMASSMKEKDFIEGTMITNSITRAQKQIRIRNFGVRRSTDFILYNLKQVYDRIEQWFQDIQNNLESEKRWEWNEFYERQINLYIERNITPLIKEQQLSQKTAMNIAAQLKKDFSVELIRFTIELADAKNENALKIIHTSIKEYLNALFVHSQSAMIEAKKFIREENKNIKINESFFDDVTKRLNEYRRFNKKISDDDDIIKPASLASEPEEAEVEEKTDVLDASYFTTGIYNKLEIPEGVAKKMSLAAIEALENLQLAEQESDATIRIQKIFSALEHLHKKLNEEYHANRVQVFKMLAGPYKKGNLYQKRNPFSTTYQVVLRNWMLFLETYERQQFTSTLKFSNRADQNRYLSEAIRSTWDKIDRELPTVILRALFLLEHPKQLDNLFWYEDNHVSTPKRIEEPDVDWDDPIIDLANDLSISEELTQDEQIVKEYLNRVKSNLNESTFTHASNTLYRFVRSNPLSSLRKTQDVHRALENWFNKEIDDGVGKERRKLNRKHLRSFLKLTNKKRLTASLPGIGTRFSFSIRKMAQNFKDARLVLQIAQLLFIALIAFALAFLWGNGIGFDLNPTEYAIDQWLFFGLNASGNALGIIFLSVTIQRFLVPGPTPISNAIVLISAFLLSISCYWNGETWGSTSGSIITITLIPYLALLINNSMYSFKSTMGLDLLRQWFLFSVLLYSCVYLGNHSLSALALFAILAAGFLIWLGTYNVEEIRFASARVVKTAASMEIDKIHTGYLITGSSVENFVLAYVLTLLVGLIPQLTGSETMLDFQNTSYYNFLLSALYGITALSLARTRIKNRVNIKSWEEKGLKRKEMVVGKNDQLQYLSAVLQKIHKNLLTREVIFTLSSLVLVNLVLPFVSTDQLPIPLSLTVLTAAVFIGQGVFAFIKEWKNLLIQRMPGEFEIIDFAQVKTKKEKKSLITLIKEFFDPISKLASIIRGLLFVIALLAGVYKVYQEISAFYSD